MKKCSICEKGSLIKVEDIILPLEGYVFLVKGERCDKCNEEFPYEEETQKTIEIAKKLGIWPEPLKLYRHLSKSGGGLVFRIPSDLEKQLKLNENTKIEITKMGNKIVIEPN
ncbi:MAG: AbrB/MazE/SpoVT family DNA-binding domain-containing protein [Nanoarchaeota archaeon]|nr:AbrB/MazE/SpoVT family DNA-binding domain-containing protein [Nanoarchaeota archaeon]